MRGKRERIITIKPEFVKCISAQKTVFKIQQKIHLI